MERPHQHHNKESFTDSELCHEELSNLPRPHPWTVLQVASETQPEYASSIWDKSVKCNINKIEAVQRCTAHFPGHDYQRTSSVSAVLQKLKWESVQEWHARSRVLILYRIRNIMILSPLLLLGTFNQFLLALEDLKHSTCRSNATQTNTVNPSFLTPSVSLEHSAHRCLPVVPDRFRAHLSSIQLI